MSKWLSLLSSCHVMLCNAISDQISTTWCIDIDIEVPMDMAPGTWYGIKLLLSYYDLIVPFLIFHSIHSVLS